MTAPYIPWELVLPGILIALAVGLAINAGINTRYRYRDMPVDLRNPACRSCRHSLKGIPGTKCPECGFDFAIGGVYRSSLSLRLNLFLVWAMLSTSMLVFTWMCLSSWSGRGVVNGSNSTWRTITILVISIIGGLLFLRYVVQKYRRIQFTRSRCQEQSQDETNSRADRD